MVPWRPAGRVTAWRLAAGTWSARPLVPDRSLAMFLGHRASARSRSALDSTDGPAVQILLVRGDSDRPEGGRLTHAIGPVDRILVELRDEVLAVDANDFQHLLAGQPVRSENPKLADDQRSSAVLAIGFQPRCYRDEGDPRTEV